MTDVVQERRCGEDRRSCDIGAPDGTPERRRRGRPRTGRRKYVVTHFSLPEDTEKRLKDFAVSKGRTKNGVIRALVLAMLAKYAPVTPAISDVANKSTSTDPS